MLPVWLALQPAVGRCFCGHSEQARCVFVLANVDGHHFELLTSGLSLLLVALVLRWQAAQVMRCSTRVQMHCVTGGSPLLE